MSEFLIEPAALASFMADQPGLLLLEECAGFENLGLMMWFGRSLGQERFFLSVQRDADPESAVPLQAPSIGILAVLAEQSDLCEPWRTWFSTHLGERIPEFLLAHDPTATSRIVKSLLAREKRAVEACADLQIELVRLRQDLEMTQIPTAGLVRALSYRPQASLQLRANITAGNQVVMLDAAAPWLIQPLGTRLDRIAAVEIRVAQSSLASSDHVRVRLSGIETGRIYGSWLVPGQALQPGWLMLELPAPVGWGPQTAQLEFHCGAGDEGALGLSANAAVGFENNRARRPGHESLPCELAVKIWLAEPGNRFVVAPFWNESEFGVMNHPSGASLAMPMAAYRQVRAIGGSLAQAYDPSAAAPLVIETAGQQSLLIFPMVSVAGMDVIEATLGLRLGDVRQLTACLWLQPAGRAIRSEEDLLIPDPAVSWTGWFGWGGRGDLKLNLEIPPDSAPVAQLVLAIDHVTRRKASQAVVELRRLSLFAVNPGKRARRERLLIEEHTEPSPKPVELPEEFRHDAARVAFEEVKLEEHFDNHSGYRHLDLSIRDLAIDEFHWPFLRFRIVAEQERPCLEFRDISSWQKSLRHWPFDTAEESGRLARFFGDESEIEPLKRAAPAHDLALISGLLAALPAIVSGSVVSVAMKHAEAEQWVEDAAALVLRLAWVADLL